MPFYTTAMEKLSPQREAEANTRTFSNASTCVEQTEGEIYDTHGGSSSNTPERPQLSLKYDTPIALTTPTRIHLPVRPASMLSETQLSKSPRDLSLNSGPFFSATGIGLGEFQSGTAVHTQRRTSNTRPPPLRSYRARLPSWPASSRGPANTILESIGKILAFTSEVEGAGTESSPVKSDSVNFKAFIDANKEIVMAWHMMEGEVKGHVRLERKVESIHAILASWKHDFDANWVTEAMELTTLDLDFAKEWEVATGMKVGKSTAADKGRDVTMKEATQADIFTSVGDSAVDEAPESDENMGYIAPLPILAGTETGDGDSRVPLAKDNSQADRHSIDCVGSDRCSSPGSNTSSISNDSNVIASVILREHFRYCPSAPAPKQTTLDEAFQFHERLERIENFLHHQSENRVQEDRLASQKIDDLKDLIVQQSTSQITSAEKHIETITNTLDQAIAQSLGRIETTLERHFTDFKNTFRHQPSRQLTLGDFEEALDQHLVKIEHQFDKRYDQLKEDIDGLLTQHSTKTTSFLNQLTHLSSVSRLDQSESLLQKGLAKQVSAPSLKNHAKEHLRSTSILEKGAMIQSIHGIIVRIWDDLDVRQKRSSLNVVKRHISEWRETCRVIPVNDHRSDLETSKGVFPSSIQSSEAAQSLHRTESIEKMKNEMDLIDEHIAALCQVVVLEEKLEEKLAALKKAKKELLEVKMDTNWVSSALDKAADICWPQRDPDVTYAQSTADTDANDSEDDDCGYQLGGRGGGGSGGSCAVM